LGPRIAIIVRKETMERCTGRGCLQAFFARKDAFAGYDATAELISFTHDGGDLVKKIAKLKEYGVDLVHLSSCIRGRSDHYEELAQRLAKDFVVVGYTHGQERGRIRDALMLPRNEIP
jgi:predicted metal-binding protein